MRQNKSLSFFKSLGVMKLQSRRLSYALMLGNIKTAKDVIAEINPNVKVVDWYDVHHAVEANAMLDESSQIIVENHIGVLLYMLKTHKYIETKFNVWSERDFK